MTRTGADQEVVQLLGRLGSRSGTRPLLRLLNVSTDQHQKQSILLALWQIPADRRAIPTLVHLTTQGVETEKVRGLAAEMLGMFKCTRSIRLALAKALVDPAPGVRISALCALGGSGCSEMLPLVRSLVDDTARYPGGRPVGECAAEVLSAIESERRDSRNGTHRGD
jgi:HEAT repeat protein